jgi:hypothetical protein
MASQGSLLEAVCLIGKSLSMFYWDKILLQSLEAYERHISLQTNCGQNFNIGKIFMGVSVAIACLQVHLCVK